ncbi:hypothetical protein [Maridesulfovibrio bastinii]|uniref:hypothetical protein n=1 Tax=Maridesulfovibrio bastinii TaxID=47157 RepID=UPI000409B8D4|nr:hypothetical protein [Maridesulfovibrio bastinii]
MSFLRHAVVRQSEHSPWRLLVVGAEKCKLKGSYVRARQIGDRICCPMCDKLCKCPEDVEHDQQVFIIKDSGVRNRDG